MKLIHDCVRDVMLDIEKNLTLDNTISSLDIQSRLPKYSHDDIFYTCKKLDEAGYLEINIELDALIHIRNMTYNGHVFLDSIRDNKIWAEVKSKISKLASVSLPIIQQVASQTITNKLGF